jgi:type I restriction enzyme S subunit
MDEIYKLGDLADIGRGSSPRPITDPRYFVDGNIPWIKIADATASGKYIYETKEHVNDYGASFSKKLKPNTLIIAASGTLGFPKFLGCEGCIHDGWIYFSDIKENLILPDYLYYYLITLRGYYNNLSYGAAIQNINTPIIKKTKIYLPTIREQKQIAEMLSAYDRLIENNNHRIAIMEDIAQELYKEWFVRFRFPEYKNTKFENGIPLGWKRLHFSDIAEIGRGSSPRPISDQRYFENGSIPWIKIADATSSKIYIHTTKEHVNDYGASFSRKLPAGSLILAASGTLGFPMFLAVEGCIHDGWLYFSNFEKKYSKYIYYVLMDLRKVFNNVSYGAAIQNINTEIVRKSNILIPDDTTLFKFAGYVEELHNSIMNLQQQNQNLEKQRDMLLPRLMSGKLEV